MLPCPECKKKISETSDSCPYCAYKIYPGEMDKIRTLEQIKKQRILIVVIGVFAISLIVFFKLKLWQGNHENKGAPNQTNYYIEAPKSEPDKTDESEYLKQTPIIESNSNPFTIKSKKDISFAGKSKMVYRILMNKNSLPSESEMKNIGIHLWRDGNTNWNDFTVFIYLPEMDITSSAYGIGTFNEKGLIEFMINKYSLYGTKWEKYAK